MLSCCIDLLPQYGQYLASFLVDIPITWNFILQLVHTNVAAIMDNAIYNVRLRTNMLCIIDLDGVYIPFCDGALAFLLYYNSF